MAHSSRKTRWSNTPIPAPALNRGSPLATHWNLSEGDKVVTRLPPPWHLPRAEGAGISTYMASHHQQTLLRPAAAVVCLTATWGNSAPLLLCLPLSAAHRYLSNITMGLERRGDTTVAPALNPWSLAPTHPQDCYLSGCRATLSLWTVWFLFPSSGITAALLCLPAPAAPQSSQPTCPSPSPPALSAPTAAQPAP